MSWFWCWACFWLGVLGHTGIACAQAGTLSTARDSLVSAAAGSKVVFGGGTNSSGPSATVDVYDISTGKWNSTGNLSVPRNNLAVAAANNMVVFAGGVSGNNTSYFDVDTVDIYSAATDSWNSTSTGAGSLSLARSSLAAAAAGDKIIFAGGLLLNGSIVDVVDIYDATTGLWSSSSGSLSEARYSLAAAGAGHLVVFAGGFNSTGPSDTVDIYDTITGLWNSTATGAGSLSRARGFLGVAAAGGKVVFAGGRETTGPVATVDVLNLQTLQWTSTASGAGSLSVPRAGLAAGATTTQLVFGGGGRQRYLCSQLFLIRTSFSSTYSAAIDVFDINTDAWDTTTGDLSIARTTLAAAGAGTQVLFGGGQNGRNSYVAAVDIYDSAYSGVNFATTAAASTSVASVTATSLTSSIAAASTSFGPATSTGATSSGGGSSLSAAAIAGITVAAVLRQFDIADLLALNMRLQVVVAVGLLAGIGVILCWNKQLIAAVHELRMARLIRERAPSFDTEI